MWVKIQNGFDLPFGGLNQKKEKVLNRILLNSKSTLTTEDFYISLFGKIRPARRLVF